MTSNLVLEACAIAALAGYGVVLRRSLSGPKIVMHVVNAATAVAVTIYCVRLAQLDIEHVIAIVGYEIVAAAVSFIALRGERWAVEFSYAIFAVHFCAIAFAALFAFTFHL